MAAMPTRKLGSQGLVSSAQGLGCMGMSAFYSTIGSSEEDSIAVIHRALELGVTHLDTSGARCGTDHPLRGLINEYLHECSVGARSSGDATHAACRLLRP